MNRSLTWNTEHWQEDFFSLFFFGRWYKNRRSSDSGSHDLVLQTRREKLNYHLRSKVLLAKTYIKSLPTLPPPHRVVPQENKKTRSQEREFISSQLNRAAAVSTGKKTMRGFKGWFHLHSQLQSATLFSAVGFVLSGKHTRESQHTSSHVSVQNIQ